MFTACFAAMMCKEVLIDGTPAAIAILDVMPKRDSGFAQLPAQIDFLAAVKGWEVDQPHFDVFKLAAEFLNSLNRSFKRARGALLTGTLLEDSVPRRDHTARKRDAVRDSGQFRIRLLVRFFLFSYAEQQAFHFRQESFGLEQVEKSGHGRRVEYSKGG